MQTHIIVQDLSKINKYEDYENIVKGIPADMDIGLVVNNAGLGTPGPFKDVDSLENLVAVNALHPIYMTKAMINLKFEKRQFRSGILNVSSTMSRTLVPGFTTYGATKKILSTFTKILGMEASMYKKPWDVLDYRPGFMPTKLSG